MAKVPCGITFEGKKYTPEQFMAKLMDGSLDADIMPKISKEEFTTITEKATMPDGEDGVKVTLQKPDGEKVELGVMYPEDVETEVAKKIRGYKLQQAKPEAATEPQAEQPATDFTGKNVTFEHAGSDVSGVVVGTDEKGNLKVKDARGINYTVNPANARDTQLITEAKQSYQDNLKKIEGLMKAAEKPTKKKPPTDIKQAGFGGIVTLPFKALGVGDKYVAAIANKVEDAVAKSFRRGMDNSNKFTSRASSEAQGIFRQLALTGSEIVKRRKALGAINVAPLKAVKFYQNAVDMVGKTPEALQNVHMVLDPEAYSARGITPKTEADLSPSEKNLYDLLRATNDAIHDWHFANGRISQETYLKNKGTYAPRFYDNIEFGTLPNDLKETFEDYAKVQNFSYVKERQKFEDVMNENAITEDPAYGTAMRLAQMLRNQAVMEYAADLNQSIKTYNEGDADIPSSYIKLEGGGRFGNIRTYGDLTNKYVPRDIAEDFKGFTFINSMIDHAYKAFKIYDRNAIRNLIKKSKTLYNPITQLGNIGSNYVFAMMNGIDPLTFQARKFEAANEVKNQGPLYVKLVEEGLLGTDITTKDLRLEVKPEQKKGGFRGLLSDIDDKISEFYGSRDDIAKVAAYLAHTKDYGRTEQDAINRVSEGFQNYNNVGRFYDFAAKTPVVGNPYIKFKGDLLRIMKNNFAKRPLTNMALLMGLNAIADAFSKWSEEDEDLREARERRAFIPKVPLPGILGGDIPLVWKTPIGEINAARYFSPMNIYDMGDRSSVLEEVTQFLPYQLKVEEGKLPSPAIGDPFLGVYAQLVQDKDFRGMPILDPQSNKWREGNATTWDKGVNAFNFVARQQIPFYSNADDFWRAVNDEPDYYGRNRDLKQAILNNFVKVKEFEKPEAVAELNKEIDRRFDQLDKINRQIKAAKNLAEKNIAEIRGRNIPEASKQEQIKEQYLQAQKKIAELMDEQADIKAKLLEPQDLLKRLGGSSSGRTVSGSTRGSRF